MMEKQKIRQGGEGDTLSSNRHISGSKIADCGNARSLGNDCGHSQCERGREPPLRFVPERVAGTAETLHVLQAHAGSIGHLASGRRKRLAQEPMKQADLLAFRRACRTDAADQFAEIARIGLMQDDERPSTQFQSNPVCPEEHGVDSVDAGAGR
jgi:hypothetical protein